MPLRPGSQFTLSQRNTSDNSFFSSFGSITQGIIDFAREGADIYRDVMDTRRNAPVWTDSVADNTRPANAAQPTYVGGAPTTTASKDNQTLIIVGIVALALVMLA